MRHTDTENWPNTNSNWTAILRDLTITTQLFNSRVLYIKNEYCHLYRAHSMVRQVSPRFGRPEKIPWTGNMNIHIYKIKKKKKIFVVACIMQK